MRTRTIIFLDAGLLSNARELTGIAGTSELIHQALEIFTERQSAWQLAEVGGTMPGLKNIPRRRSKKSK